jgi:hypothetical protein
MGFSDALIPRAREHLPLFDPAMVGVDTLVKLYRVPQDIQYPEQEARQNLT